MWVTTPFAHLSILGLPARVVHGDLVSVEVAAQFTGVDKLEAFLDGLVYAPSATVLRSDLAAAFVAANPRVVASSALIEARLAARGVTAGPVIRDPENWQRQGLCWIGVRLT